MRTYKKVFLVFLVALFSVSVYTQNVPTVSHTFKIVNDFGKSLTGKKMWEVDYIREDTLRYFKIIFQDQAKTYNNGMSF